MSLNNPYLQYRQSQIETASKLKLIVMLYDGAIRFLHQSSSAMKVLNHEEKGLYINKATAILFHLTGTLDPVHGGELAMNLAGIYQYMIKRLVEANQKNDCAIIEEVIFHLKELRGAWNTVSNGIEAEKAPQPESSLPDSRIDFSMAA